LSVPGRLHQDDHLVTAIERLALDRAADLGQILSGDVGPLAEHLSREGRFDGGQARACHFSCRRAIPMSCTGIAHLPHKWIRRCALVAKLFVEDKAPCVGKESSADPNEDVLREYFIVLPDQQVVRKWSECHLTNDGVKKLQEAFPSRKIRRSRPTPFSLRRLRRTCLTYRKWLPLSRQFVSQAAVLRTPRETTEFRGARRGRFVSRGLAEYFARRGRQPQSSPMRSDCARLGLALQPTILPASPSAPSGKQRSPSLQRSPRTGPAGRSRSCCPRARSRLP